MINKLLIFPFLNSSLPVNRPCRGKLASSGPVPFNIPSTPLTLSSQLSATSRNGPIHLQILCQPEQQHRARYQTEGSRGAVKDRTGNGFPVVKVSSCTNL